MINNRSKQIQRDKVPQLLEMARAGMRTEEIAEALGLAPVTVCRHRRLAGIQNPLRPIVNLPDAMEVAEVRRRTLAGESVAHIAAAMNLCARTVERHRGRAQVLQPRNRGPLSETELLRAKMLLVDGASYGEVLRTLRPSLGTRCGHSGSMKTLTQLLPGFEIDKKQAGLLSRMQRDLNALTWRDLPVDKFCPPEVVGG